ncbi:MAG: MATE family efflux transporter [Lactimicrobium sp.]|uniref:MATE family efflux transporter n=1 Tax=Lactimicrobium sp. TaxID=2563780 RepID=UPI002F35572C
MQENAMKERPLLPLILTMTIPMMLSMLVNSLYNIVDSFFVAKMGEDAMTSLSLVFPIQNLIGAAAIGYGVGINAIISFYLGARKQDQADQAASLGMRLSVVHGLVLGLLGTLVMPEFLRMFTDNPQIISYGVRYAAVAFAFGFVSNAGIAFEKVFQAVGQMNVTVVSLAAGCVFNIVMDPILIFGIGIFPKMGMEGAALATGLGQLVSLLIYCVRYHDHPLPVHIGMHRCKDDARMAKRIYAVGIPAILNLALPSLLITCLNSILAKFAPVYILVLGIYYKLQTFLYLPSSGIIQGMRPLLGYNYGAGEYGRVKKIIGIVLVMILILMSAGTILFMVCPGWPMGLFTTSQETIQAGSKALRIIAAGFIVSAVSITASGALEGLSKGTQSLWISLFRYVILIIPAAFVLSHLFGADGVFHAFWVSEVLSAIIAWFILKKAVPSASAESTAIAQE